MDNKHKTSAPLSPKQLQAELEVLKSKIQRLRACFEQYFMGIERRVPNQLRQDVARLIRQIERQPTNNTSVKFQIRTVSQQFLTYNNYWNRTLRQIENGTYHRHLAKIDRRKHREKEHAKATLEASRAEEVEAAKDPKQQALLNSINSAADDFLASLDLAIGADLLAGLDSAPQQAVYQRATPSQNQSPVSSLEKNHFWDGVSQNQPSNKSTTQSPRPPSRTGAPQQPPRPPSRTGIPQQLPRPPSRTGISQQPPRPPSRTGVPQPPRPPSRATATQPQRAAAPQRALSPQEVRKRHLYTEFINAQRAQGRPSKRAPNYASFERSLEKQTRQVQSKHQCKKVSFKVVLRDGRPFLQPVIHR